MEARSCKVTVVDKEGIEHSAHVVATTLYEAVAMGLRAMRQTDWLSADALSARTILVTVQSVAVSHKVNSMVFHNWLAQQGTSPAEMTKRRKVREIMGIVDPRR